MNGRELKKWANSLPDDATILAQVVSQESPNAWHMEISLSGELSQFKWKTPVYPISLSHPDLKDVNEGFKKHSNAPED